MAEITTHQLVKEFPGGVRAVDGLDLTIADGEFFALLGPSGCGKTTLLRTIAGLEAATKGRLTIGDRDVTELPPGKRDVAMVFQDYALFPHMSVADNISYPLKIQRVPKSSRHATAAETADGLALHGLIDRRPGQLSGGQQQRVALARAVASNPTVFLFDEPLSNLDARLRLEARTFLKRLQRDLGVTTVFVTHDQAEALALADRIAIMKEGRIQQIGSPREVFARPANTFVASFVGSTPMNLHTATVSGEHVKVAGSSVPIPPSARSRVSDGDEVIWGARPEYLRWSTEPVEDSIEGSATIVENLGAAALVTVDAGGTLIQLVVDEDDEPEMGARGWVVPRIDRTLLFDGASGELILDDTPTSP
ncbi:ABC transporter ATP-binding protein [Actinobacteria bacterium YIM 96077]|uniref:ABC transporter n=1 Tax=Phytoactinopolyspora halophila TaxID=1981511 RepID=A0A329QTB4_9ACTN|nr:ABC transporter ATP-binding protein [Phytoactinopolyspora halophila]AYY13892.1 ABC transporter ATP-binding protein [Actinobacteria bacterium YIM 96077]RAW15565.1 ABC transporter [Phytoactinopolyspora halophila]